MITANGKGDEFDNDHDVNTKENKVTGMTGWQSLWSFRRQFCSKQWWRWTWQDQAEGTWLWQWGWCLLRRNVGESIWPWSRGRGFHSPPATGLPRRSGSAVPAELILVIVWKQKTTFWEFIGSGVTNRPEYCPQSHQPHHPPNWFCLRHWLKPLPSLTPHHHKAEVLPLCFSHFGRDRHKQAFLKLLGRLSL